MGSRRVGNVACCKTCLVHKSLEIWETQISFLADAACRRIGVCTRIGCIVQYSSSVICLFAQRLVNTVPLYWTSHVIHVQLYNNLSRYALHYTIIMPYRPFSTDPWAQDMTPTIV